MAKRVALNPASMPFFPGEFWSNDDDCGPNSGLGQHINREQDHTSSSSSVSLSPTEYRSVRSSPSPPQEERTSDRVVRFQSSPTPGEEEHTSPTLRQIDAGKPYPAIETRAREPSMLGSLKALSESVPSESQAADGTVRLSGRASPFVSPTSSHGRDRSLRSPAPPNSNGSLRSPFTTSTPFTSSPPPSSMDSASQFTPGYDKSLGFESQLKASPIIHEIMDRLARYEYTTREIQRDLGEVHHKVNILVERALAGSTPGQPEFKDPFSPVNLNGPTFSGLNGPRGSIVGGIAPNQVGPSDDITQISQRLNTLTSSVSQLLALQTQQRIQTTTAAALSGNPMIGPIPHQGDVAPNQIMAAPVASQGILGHGLPNRPDIRPGSRVPNPPMRTWSVGALDLPLRSSDPAAAVGRQEALLRDKRRSVTSLMRRESSGFTDSAAENWPGNSPRDAGPQVSKWEQLSLAPELLRSLSKFGVGPPNKIQQRALPFLLRGSDIIAQAPPTQERIAAYVIPSIQVAVTHMNARTPNRGPIVIMLSTTVDQATQAQRMIRDLGGPIGVRSALGVGTTSVGSDLTQELRLLQQNMPHVLCGTPQKLHALFTAPGGLVGSEVRFLVLDEVDQLIARNLHEFVFNIVKLLPPPRSRAPGGASPNALAVPSTFSQFDGAGNASPIPTQVQNGGRGFSSMSPAPGGNESINVTPTPPIERQTALFSNTVPQDVLNLATAIQLREPVRVLVRRDGNVSYPDANQGSRGLRQFYLYLAFTAGGRADPLAAAPGGGLGIIGSGRSSSSAESAQAREWKLDALADLFDDVDVPQAIVHVGGMVALDSVVYKLASRSLEAVPLHGDMNAGTKLAALNKFRGSPSVIIRQPVTKVLVVYDVQVKTPEVNHVPLIINYDLPKAVEEYAHRVAPAVASNYSRAGVVVNFVTATGGDVEMLRSIECFYKIKCPEVPMSLRDLV